MLMRAKDSTLLVIDLQERLLPAIDGGAAVVEQATWLVRLALRLQVPVIATEQYPKGLGFTEPSLHELLPAEGLREKIHFSATAGAGLFDLPGGERRQFVVCGSETHVCVLQTVLGLLAAGREVYVVDEGRRFAPTARQGAGAGADGARWRGDRLAARWWRSSGWSRLGPRRFVRSVGASFAEPVAAKAPPTSGAGLADSGWARSARSGSCVNSFPAHGHVCAG